MTQIFSMLLDAGLGASALYLASRLVTKVNMLEKKHLDHEVRIVFLEKRVA
jgi:hypothetical protein